MKKYVVRGSWEGDGYENLSRSMTVHATEPETEDTGLLDECGYPILAQYQTEPVGFHLAQWGYKMACKKGKGGKKRKQPGDGI